MSNAKASGFCRLPELDRQEVEVDSKRRCNREAGVEMRWREATFLAADLNISRSDVGVADGEDDGSSS